MALLRRISSMLLVLCLGQSAYAATFSFTGLGSVSSSGYSSTVDGITVTVTTPGANDLAYRWNGLILDGGLGSSGGLLDPKYIGYGESLQVSFSESVTVSNLKLNDWGLLDNGKVMSSGGSKHLCSLCNGNFDLSSLGSISSFTLKGGLGASFYLAGLTVEPATAVPVPAAAWLFMSGLVGLVGKKRLARR